MSAFREWLDAIGRTLGYPVVERDGDVDAARERLVAALAPEPGPRPLDWSSAMFIPSSPDRRAHVTIGEFYGRPFQVLFPSGPASDGHVWGLACWPVKVSGTGQPEVRAACRTCSDAAGWCVGPLACVTSAEAGWTPDDYRGA